MPIGNKVIIAEIDPERGGSWSIEVVLNRAMRMIAREYWRYQEEKPNFIIVESLFFDDVCMSSQSFFTKELKVAMEKLNLKVSRVEGVLACFLGGPDSLMRCIKEGIIKKSGNDKIEFLNKVIPLNHPVLYQIIE